ncbi:MAG: hypothetical protein WAT43_01120 [Chitinophagales bacterium]|nr:hypothetical protein [Bacteroidota bacterium]
MLWLFNALSDEHEDEIYVNLTYELAPNKTNVNRLPSRAVLQVASTGWQLLREQFNTRSLTIDLADYKEDKTLLTNQHTKLFSDALPEDIRVNHIFPDTLDMHIATKLNKKIPVKVSFRGIAENNWLIDSVYYYPDSIIISGADNIVNKIKYWPTETITIYDIDSILKGVAILKPAPESNINISAIAVAYGIRVYKITSQVYALNITNPKNSEKQIAVQIECEIPSLHVEETSVTDFEVTLLPIAPKGTYAIKCTKFPDWAQNINVQPAFISVTSAQ